VLCISVSGGEYLGFHARKPSIMYKLQRFRLLESSKDWPLRTANVITFSTGWPVHYTAAFNVEHTRITVRRLSRNSRAMRLFDHPA
jgi:hypothetical protein